MNSDFDPKDPFHAIALWAYVIEANKVQGEPHSDKVRRRAYKMYEDLKRGR